VNSISDMIESAEHDRLTALAAEYVGLDEAMKMMAEQMAAIRKTFLEAEGKRLNYQGTTYHGLFEVKYSEKAVGGWNRAGITRLAQRPDLPVFKTLVSHQLTFSDDRFLKLPPAEQMLVMKARTGRKKEPEVKITTRQQKINAKKGRRK